LVRPIAATRRASAAAAARRVEALARRLAHKTDPLRPPLG
jgi:hypothetical protein